MESEKARVVSVPSTRTVGSENRRVPVSAARVVATAADAFLRSRSLSGSFSSAGSFPIRAPLTLDEDDDSGSGTEEHSFASSAASNYSRGHDSGTDDGFESVSGDEGNEDVILGGIGVHRVLGEELGGGTGDGSELSGGSVIYRPYTRDIDEETSVNYSSLEEESENSDEVGGISESEVSVKAKVVIPRAILSLEDDESDDILGSDDEEEATLARVTKTGSHFEDMGMVEEPECSGSAIREFVSEEEEVVRMNYSDKLDDGLIALGNIEQLSLELPPGGSNEGTSVEACLGLGESFKQHIEKEVVQKGIIKEDDSGNIHEDDRLMEPGDVQGMELGEMEMTDKLECSGSAIGGLVFTKEDMLVNDGLVIETTEGNSLGVALRDCNEYLVESEGYAVCADQGLDETSRQLAEQGVVEGSISKENDSKIKYGSSCDADESMIPGEGAIRIGRTESGDEDLGTLVCKAQERQENEVMVLEKPECEGAPKIGMIYESFQLTPTINSVTTRNLEIAKGIDVFVSGYGSSDQKSEQESENEGKQESESEDTDRKLFLPYEDSDRNCSSNLRSSFETANETVEDGEQISEQISKQLSFQSDSQPNQNTLGVEETSLLSIKEVERSLPDNTSVTAYDISENETQMTRLIHNQTPMELDEYEETSDTRGKLPESTFQKYFEELSSDHSVQLISEKVKKRVEKTQLLKEKLQPIIRGGLCTEYSANTEVMSKLSLVGVEHQTSKGLVTVPDRTKVMLPGQNFPDHVDFCINVLVIGKTGVGKSATVNSIFGETKSPVGAFDVTTKSANYVVGNVGGVRVRILDTPGLMSSAAEERLNQEVLMAIKKNMRTFPVDVILYIDRLDENPDIHLLRTITSFLGSSIWRNAIVVLTHAASDVSDSSSYKDYIGQRSSFMHQSIRRAVPELSHVDESKMPEILLAENNMSSFCGRKTSETTCPDWRMNLLILCCSVKIQSKADSLRKHQIFVAKRDVIGSPLRSFALFCSLWNVLLHGANPGHTSHLHKDLEEKKQRILDSNSEILWDKQSREEYLEKETLPMKNQKAEDEERRAEEGTVLGCERIRRGRLGFQATRRLGIYLDTSELHTGFSIGDYRKHEEGERRILVRMRGSLAILGLVPMLASVFNSVYGRKNI